tara:strand:- start:509 stop:703 length:195 start_codon:yes stop_codon:yes gene_type:complete
MADEIRYGAGGIPYVGAGGSSAPAAAAPVVEEKPEEPIVTVEVIEDDTPLDEVAVQKKAKGNGK